MEEKKVYKKICVYCGKEYESTSRGKRYCSDECCTKANERNTKIKKKRKKANKERKAFEVENRLLTRAYSMVNFVADTFYLSHCNCEYCKGDHEKYLFGGKQRISKPLTEFLNE